MRARVRGRVAFVVLGVRAKDIPGVAEEAAVRAWLQGVRADLEQVGLGAITIEFEWHGWLESPLLQEELACLELAELAAHARTLTAEPIAGGLVAIVNCRLARTGASGGDVVADWITHGGQGGLRRCRYCGALHLAPNAALSHCWGSPEGGHVFDDRGTFELARATEGEIHYQNCSSCHAIWAFDGNSRGHCPKNPTGHTGGDRFSLARAADGDVQWAECRDCQRVISVELADRGCLESTEGVPVPHNLDLDRPLAVAQESFPTSSWGTRAVAAAIGIHDDLDATGRGFRPAPHPRFAERGPVPPLTASWLAGWLPPERVITVTWKPGRRFEATIGLADAAAPEPVLLQIDAPGGVYTVEARSGRGIESHLPADERLQLRRLLGRGARGVDGWRACTACGVAVDTAELGCRAGGVHAFESTDLAVPFDNGYVRAVPGWRRCFRCNGLWHAGSGEGSACAAGGEHRSDMSTAYALRTSETGTGFRACSRCRTLIDPQRATAPCAAGGAHEVRRSPFFTLDVVRRGASTHQGWSTCRKCGIVGYTRSQRCAKTGGAHVLEDHDHAAERWRIVPGIVSTWRCTKCACMFGHAGACAAGGRHSAAGLFPEFALREASVVDRVSVPQGAEPRFPGGAQAMLALRRHWQICRECGVVFTPGTGTKCAAKSGKHVAVGPKLVMSSARLESWRVLVAVGDELHADRDAFKVTLVERDDAEAKLVVESVPIADA